MNINAEARGLRPLDVLAGLVLEDGQTWGQVAEDWQRADAEALLDLSAGAPRLHFLTRPRGGSKTTDTGAASLAALICQAPERSTSHAFARDRDQAARLVDVIGGLVARTGLAGLVDVGSWAVTVRSTGARLSVESADAASAHGALPWLVLVDELAQWPETRGAQALWQAIVSGLPKRSDSRLAVLTTAGDPAHWSAKVLTSALGSPRWHVSQVPGPLPWLNPDDLAEQERLLPSSVFARLHLNRWTAAEDRLVGAEDLAACVTLDGPQDYDLHSRYVIGLDLGLKHDRTVLTVAHAEGSPRRVVLDRMEVLSGTRDRPVSLQAIEDLAYQAATTYRAPVRVDPWQAVGLAQRLRARGVSITEVSFTPALVGRLAMTLHLLLREHRLALPDDEDLLDELGTVRLRETTPGVFRLDHDAGNHDDRAVSLGLAAVALMEAAEAGRGSITVPRGHRGAASPSQVAGSGRRGGLALPTRHQVVEAARREPTLPGGAIIGVPGDYRDQSRRNP